MSSLSGIVVPLDGSDCAEQALPIASRLATAAGATLRLIMVHGRFVPSGVCLDDPIASAELDLQTQWREQMHLEAVAARLRREAGIPVQCELLEGDVVTAIAKFVDQTETDLVVMTSHGHGGLKPLFLGNVADELVCRLGIPIMLLHPEASTAALPEVGRILVPLDGSALAESVLDQAKAFAWLIKAELVLVSVIQPIAALMPPFVFPPELQMQTPEVREAAVRKYLTGVEQRVRGEGLRVRSRIRTGPKVAREILEVAREDKCTLIAVATHGASGLDRMLLGSVASQVTRHSTIPVLLVHPPVRTDDGTAKAAVEPAAAAAIA